MTEVVEDELLSDELEDIASRITHLLGIYPGISPTMLQAGLGPQTKATAWRPVLEDMIDNGIVKKQVQAATTPKGRHNDYTKLFLI